MKTRVDLITGFLGAGKTTFLLRYAAWLQGRGVRVAVIENEFGLAGCDGAVLKDVGLDVTELSGGCICCALKVDFAHAIVELAGRVDRVLVEPSGIFTPADFFAVMQSPMVREACDVGFVAAIANPHGGALIGDAAAVWSAQLDAAGVVIVSQTDGMDENAVAAAVLRLQDCAGLRDVPVLTKPWPLWTDEDFLVVTQCGARTETFASAAAVNHATIYNSATFVPALLYTEADLRRRLAAVLADAGCGVVLRIKGAVRGANGGLLSVNVTETGVLVLPLHGGTADCMLNVIGRGVARRRVRAVLEE